VKDGWLSDGQSALRHSDRISGEGGGLRLHFDSGEIELVDADALTHAGSRPDAETYGCAGRPGWRLGIAPPLSADLIEVLPRRQVYGGIIDRFGLPRALLAGVALSAAFLFVGYSSPAWLAPLIPRSVEDKVGDALVGDFGHQFCDGAGGQAALDKMTAALSLRPEALNVRVVNVKMVNAAALPGGNIVIFRELITEADGPDEVAGVLGHEIAHVEERHVTEGMIRQLGFGMIVALFGGSTGANLDALLAAGYSRAAEIFPPHRPPTFLAGSLPPSANWAGSDKVSNISRPIHFRKTARLGSGAAP
jgi:hypothetical protein